jgi:hypothetical protein
LWLWQVVVDSLLNFAFLEVVMVVILEAPLLENIVESQVNILFLHLE